MTDELFVRVMHAIDTFWHSSRFAAEDRVALAKAIPNDLSVESLAWHTFINAPMAKTKELLRNTYDEGCNLTCVDRDEFVSLVLPECMAAVSWARSGKPLFALTDDFFHSIAVTDFGDSGNEEVRLPFEAFDINLPPNNLIGVSRVIIGPMARFHLEKPEILKLKEPPKEPIRVNLEMGSRIILPFGDNQPVSFSCKGKTKADWLQHHDSDGSLPPEKLEAIDTARRIIVNLTTYIDASGGLPQRKHRGGEPPAPIEREHQERPVFRVGRTVRLAPAMRDVLREGKTGQHWKLAQRFIVRGHWKNQFHGPGRALRKRMWIEPYWKGPTTIAEALERTYSVE